MSHKFIFTPHPHLLTLRVHRSAWSTAVIFVMLFVAAGSTRMDAQAVFGSIVGTVTDPTGAVVPNATVVVTDVGKGTTQTVQSNASGNYTAVTYVGNSSVASAEVAQNLTVAANVPGENTSGTGPLGSIADQAYVGGIEERENPHARGGRS